jgi:hypothetical protein
MSVIDIILISIVSISGVLCIGSGVYCKIIEPIRAKLALAEHFPMYENERHTFIENSKAVRDKLSKVQKLKSTIDRLEEETKYLTGADLLIIKGAIERLKIEYAEVSADYKLSKMTFESYKEMFYTLYPFAHSHDYDDDTPLKKEEILYKSIKNSIDN